MTTYQLYLQTKGINKKNVTFSHLMAAFLLIIMGAVSFVIIALLGQTKAAAPDADAMLYKSVSGIYIAAGIVLLALIIGMNKRIVEKKNSTILRVIEVAMLLPVCVFCINKAWYVPAAFSGIGILGIIYAFYYENAAEKPSIITINEEGIAIPNYRTSFISWDKVLRLIVRHRILTIEVNGNKLFQLDLSADQNLEVTDIETFALEQIKSNKKIIKNDW
ncbi:hypothetical protein [Edaphocola aurantiacus]|uniref:hypothetical protein n=1 Tax=Edaphocola aurantiacus TaxID=2601682 RepID=UPI001C96C65E|nr:hypothetical protein [Edaphocola aurantiacus]